MTLATTPSRLRYMQAEIDALEVPELRPSATAELLADPSLVHEAFAALASARDTARALAQAEDNIWELKDQVRRYEADVDTAESLFNSFRRHVEQVLITLSPLVRGPWRVKRPPTPTQYWQKLQDDGEHLASQLCLFNDQEVFVQFADGKVAPLAWCALVVTP